MRYLIIPVVLMTGLFGCKDDKEASDGADILDIKLASVSNETLTVDQVYIDQEEKTISLLFANNLTKEVFPLTLTLDFTLSGGASILPAQGQNLSFENEDDWNTLTVTSESGKANEYTLMIRGNQLPNSGFENWYFTTGLNAQPYKEPGLSEITTIWSTANKGTSIYNQYGTQPLTTGGNTVAVIATESTSVIPITAGTLFVGKFDTQAAINNPTDPKKAVIFGTPFSLRPVAFNFKYTYLRGETYIKATPKNATNIFGGFDVTEIEGDDQFSAYAILETRDGEEITEIARGEIISGENQPTMQEITVPFVYNSDAKPTHITVVFTSSKDGDTYTGAVGSTLTVDNLTLIY